ncbi:Vacuolar membrane amino acid uptake transporter fnx2, partial [Leucoagaricus sp. SymC.cos]
VAPILVGVFLSAMDNTIVISSFGAIGTYFDELEKTSWIATAYLLTVSSFQPLYGKLSDIFGRKSCILFAYCIFAIGCVLCGSARNMNMLIACRSLAGIGGGGMATLASIIISDLVPLRSRGTWQGLMNIVWSCGNTAGASLGGFLADSIGWRWGFFIQLPFAITSGISVYFFLKLPTPTTSSTIPNFRRIDFAGAITLVCAVFCLLFGLSRGGNIGWQNASTVASLISFALLFIIFGFIEGHIAAEPFAPPRIVFSRSLIASYLVNFLSVAASFGQLFHISLYFQAVLGKTAATTGAWLVVTIAADLSSSLICGVLMQSTGRYYWLSTGAYSVMASGIIVVMGGTGVFRTKGSLGEIVAGLAVTALGYGGGITTSLVSLIANVDRSDQAVATAVTYFFRSLGSVVGLSVGSTLVQTTLRSTLRHTVKGKDADEAS